MTGETTAADRSAARVRAYVGIGGTLSDRLAHLRGAVAALRAAPGIAAVAASPLYRSAAHRLPGQDAAPDYLNAVLALDTSLAPLALLDLLLATETDGGRTRPVPWAPRTLDLDLLLAGDAALDTPRLTLPHPRLRLRRFVLAPLADLAPALRLPPDGMTVAAALAACPDAGPCVRMGDGSWADGR